MIIGNFTYDPDKDSYTGTVTTLTAARGDILIRPTRKSGDREPDYRVEHECDGANVELGAAWKRTSEKTGPFLSVVIDDPVLPASINAALFHDKPPSHAARLVWTRPNPNAKPKTAEAERPVETPPRRARAARRPQNG